MEASLRKLNYAIRFSLEHIADNEVSCTLYGRVKRRV
jgi:hypothetical protein